MRGAGRAVLCVAALAAAACRASEETTPGVWAGEERPLPGGGTFVINPEPDAASAAPVWRFTEELRIGEEDLRGQHHGHHPVPG